MNDAPDSAPAEPTAPEPQPVAQSAPRPPEPAPPPPSEPAPQAPPPPASVQPAGDAGRAPGGCVQGPGGTFGSFLFAVFVAVLVLLGVGGITSFLGYTQSLPGDVQRTSDELSTLRQQNQVLQTQVAELTIRDTNNQELLDSLDRQMSDMQQQVTGLDERMGEMDDIVDQLGDNVVVVATTQADLHAGLAAVSTFGTIQAERAQQLDELDERTERMLRFVERLGDIAGDTTLDLEASPVPPAATEPAAPAPDEGGEASGQAPVDPVGDPTATPLPAAPSTPTNLPTPTLLPELPEPSVTIPLTPTTGLAPALTPTTNPQQAPPEGSIDPSNPNAPSDPNAPSNTNSPNSGAATPAPALTTGAALP